MDDSKNQTGSTFDVTSDNKQSETHTSTSFIIFFDLANHYVKIIDFTSLNPESVELRLSQSKP